jgi:hypothetical protein
LGCLSGAFNTWRYSWPIEGVMTYAVVGVFVYGAIGNVVLGFVDRGWSFRRASDG